MDLRRLAPLALLVPAVAAGATLKPHWPKDQSIRYELGAAASRVDELDARWAPAKAEGAHRADAPADDSDCARDVTFRYAPGRAPTTIAHTPRLPDGDYDVEVELHAAGRIAQIRRKVTLEGGTTTLDLSTVVP
jgi:hypothetical protein